MKNNLNNTNFNTIENNNSRKITIDKSFNAKSTNIITPFNIESQLCISPKTLTANQINNNTKKNYPTLKKEDISNQLLNLININTKLHNKNNSEFYMNMLYSLNQNESEKTNIYDYKLCEKMYLNNKYRECAYYITNNMLQSRGIEFQILLSQCYYSLSEYENVKEVLLEDIKELCFESNKLKNYYLSIKNTLLGKVYYFSCFKNSIDFLSQALHLDPSNYEAFEFLYNKCLISDFEMIILINNLDFDEKNIFLKDYYLSFVSHQDIVVSSNGNFIETSNEITDSNYDISIDSKNECKDILRNLNLTLLENGNSNILYLKSIKYYNNMDYLSSIDILLEILDKNSFHEEAMIYLILNYYFLEEKVKLKFFIDKITKQNKHDSNNVNNTESNICKSIISNFALACFHLLINNKEEAVYYLKNSLSIRQSYMFLSKIEEEISKSQNDGKQSYVQGICNFPAYIELYINYSNYLISKGDYKQGENIIDKAKEIMQYRNDLKSETDNKFSKYYYKNYLRISLLTCKILYNKKSLQETLSQLNHTENLLNDYINKINMSTFDYNFFIDDYIEVIKLKADVLKERNMLKEALHYYYKILEFYPNDFYSCYNIGIVYFQMKNHNLASEFFIKANFIDPKNYAVKELYNKNLSKLLGS